MSENDGTSIPKFGNVMGITGDLAPEQRPGSYCGLHLIPGGYVVLDENRHTMSGPLIKPWALSLSRSAAICSASGFVSITVSG